MLTSFSIRFVSLIDPAVLDAAPVPTSITPAESLESAVSNPATALVELDEKPIKPSLATACVPTVPVVVMAASSTVAEVPA